MGAPTDVPTLEPTPDRARAELANVLERMMWLLRRIAKEPDDLIDGQHHHVLREALAELDERIGEVGGLTQLVRYPEHFAPAPDQKRLAAAIQSALKDHGLTGKEWALKFEAFDRNFRQVLDHLEGRDKTRDAQVLDRLAYLEARDKTRDARMYEIVNANFVPPDLRKSSGRTFEIGATIADSASEALKEIPLANAIISSLKEAAGGTKALFND
jgi:hypothetical protein